MISQIEERIRNAPDAITVWSLAHQGLLLLKHYDAVTCKSIASVVRKFHADLRNLVTLGFISNDSILSDVRRVVKDGIGDAYIEGLAEGGITADEMSDDDAMMIIELTEQQAPYITDFVRAVRDAKGDKAAQRDILDNRIALWTTAIEAAGTAGLNSAKANEMVIFDGDDGEESCKTCQRLKGQRHRRNWFESKGLVPRDPRFRNNFECHGYNCRHFLRPVR